MSEASSKDTKSYEKPYEILLVENSAFKARIKALEQKLVTAQRSIRTESQTRFFNLIKEKDKALDDSTVRLNEKIKLLEKTNYDLRAKNQELQTSVSALTIYQLMFDAAPDAIIGVDVQGHIMQFNDAAVELFGMELHRLRLVHVSKLKLSGNSLNFEKIIKKALSQPDVQIMEMKYQGKDYVICSYRLTDMQKLRGVALHIYRGVNQKKKK